MTIIATDKKLRERDKHDFYPTPEGYVWAHLNYLKSHFVIEWQNKHIRILDPGAGDGVWGKVARALFPDAFIMGTEIRDLPKPEWYDAWEIVPFKEFVIPGTFDLIIGNPPYSKQEEFIDLALEMLSPNTGTMGYLLRLSFMESRKRFLKYFQVNALNKPRRIIPSVRRISFTGDKKTDDTAYAFYIWSYFESDEPYTKVDWLNWNYEIPAPKKTYQQLSLPF